MDDVMSHPRMIGQLSEDFFQDRASFLLFGVAGVALAARSRLPAGHRKEAASRSSGYAVYKVLHGFLIFSGHKFENPVAQIGE